MEGGEPRQVMLSGRELNINDLPREVSRDWFKRTYVYTHGYGAVLSPVNEILDGKPKMYIRDMDPINYEPEWTHRFNDNPDLEFTTGNAPTIMSSSIQAVRRALSLITLKRLDKILPNTRIKVKAALNFLRSYENLHTC